MNEPVNIITIAPLPIPLHCNVGVNTLKSSFRSRLNEHIKQNDEFESAYDKNIDYNNNKTDTYGISLCRWRCNAPCGSEVIVHFFPYDVAIVVIHISDEGALLSEDLEQSVQKKTIRVLESIWTKIQNAMQFLSGFQEFNHDSSPIEKPKPLWIARLVYLTEEALNKHQVFITHWLENTKDPKDAYRIIQGEQFESITWLNYVVVRNKQKDVFQHIDEIVDAQYVYAKQDMCNAKLRDTIEHAYGQVNRKNLSSIKDELRLSQAEAKLHLINYNEAQKFFSRKKRVSIENILSSWNFSILIDNGERMMSLCDDKLNQVESDYNKRGAIITDLLLVALSFLAVFELCLYLIEFSREMVTNPILDYQDTNRSMFVSFVASLDTDVVFGTGLFLTLCLIIIYRRLKSS